MRTHLFGKSQRDVSVIGQGTWNLPTSTGAQEEAVAALEAGIERGMFHIDTAEMYGSGESEEIISRVIQGKPRQNIFLVSKVLPENASYKGTIKACERSLKRLKLDYLDCYLLHWRGAHPISETIAAFGQLIDDGKIKSFGVSNFDVEDLKEAQACVDKHPIVCNQVLYHLQERGIERTLIPFCKENGIAVVGYTPFGQRQISGRDTKSGAVLHRIAEKHACTARQVVLAFLVRDASCFAIPKASKVTHAVENAGAGDVVLDTADIADIDAAFPKPSRDRPLATL